MTNQEIAHSIAQTERNRKFYESQGFKVNILEPLTARELAMRDYQPSEPKPTVDLCKVCGCVVKSMDCKTCGTPYHIF